MHVIYGTIQYDTYNPWRHPKISWYSLFYDLLQENVIIGKSIWPLTEWGDGNKFRKWYKTLRSPNKMCLKRFPSRDITKQQDIVKWSRSASFIESLWTIVEENIIAHWHSRLVKPFTIFYFRFLTGQYKKGSRFFSLIESESWTVDGPKCETIKMNTENRTCKYILRMQL